MTQINYKILAYAKANGVDEVDFKNREVVVRKPSDEALSIATWNLAIAKPTIEQLDALESEATALEQAEADADAQKVTDKVNAKAKLIAGEALTEAEADTIVL